MVIARSRKLLSARTRRSSPRSFGQRLPFRCDLLRPVEIDGAERLLDEIGDRAETDDSKPWSINICRQAGVP
jgi:hypothetical protein